MARSTQEKEERKLILPTGHPNAGYVSPDLSGIDGVETLSEEEQKAHDERNEAQQAEAEAVAEAEDKVAKEEQKRREEQDEIARKRAEYIDKQKYGETAGKLPGDASYRDPEAKSSGSKTSTSS
jgi:hypothetical protein